MTALLKIFCLLFVLVVLSPAYAQNKAVGDFDINKVQQAIAENRKNAPAQESVDQNHPTQSEQQPENLGAVIARIAAYLALIVLVVLGIFWFVKRTGAITGAKGGGGVMDVLEALPIGQGRTIVLVRVMDHVLILAQTQQRITMLEKIEGQQALEMIASTKDGTSIVQFKDVFSNFVNKMKSSS